MIGRKFIHSLIDGAEYRATQKYVELIHNAPALFLLLLTQIFSLFSFSENICAQTYRTATIY